MSVPNVNLFIGYVNCLKGKNTENEYVQDKYDTRQFYSSGKDYDYVKYVQSGSKEKIDYVAYSGNNEKSKGIFNAHGLMNEEEIKELRNKLRNTKSTIWHGVISFTEEFGNKYCDTYEKAYELMKLEFPKFFKNAKLIPDNIEWFAGLHENTDNLHIHFSFFEKAPLRTQRGTDNPRHSFGRIKIEAINQFKISIEDRLLDIRHDVKLQRTCITKQFKDFLELGDYMKKIKSLIFVLPTNGRMSYESENMKPYKQQINQVVNAIIKSDKNLYDKFVKFEKILVARDNELIKAYEKIKVDYSDKLLRDKCINDIYRRLGNLVLVTVKEVRKDQKRLEYTTKNRLLSKRLDKLKRKALVRRCMQLNDLVNREIISAFQQYLDKLEEANFKRLQEEGFFE